MPSSLTCCLYNASGHRRSYARQSMSESKTTHLAVNESKCNV